MNIQEKREKITHYLKEQSFDGEVWKEFTYSTKSDPSYIMWHISNFGRVAKNYKITFGKKHSDGYMFLGNMTPVHRLVAINFIPKTDDDIQFGRIYVDHIDGNRSNNNYTNLRWCTLSENNTFPLAMSRKNRMFGNKNPQYGKSPNNKNKVLCNNGVIAQFFNTNEIPEGWIKGRIIK